MPAGSRWTYIDNAVTDKNLDSSPPTAAGLGFGTLLHLSRLLGLTPFTVGGGGPFRVSTGWRVYSGVVLSLGVAMGLVTDLVLLKRPDAVKKTTANYITRVLNVLAVLAMFQGSALRPRSLCAVLNNALARELVPRVSAAHATLLVGLHGVLCVVAIAVLSAGAGLNLIVYGSVLLPFVSLCILYNYIAKVTMELLFGYLVVCVTRAIREVNEELRVSVEMARPRCRLYDIRAVVLRCRRRLFAATSLLRDVTRAFQLQLATVFAHDFWMTILILYSVIVTSSPVSVKAPTLAISGTLFVLTMHLSRLLYPCIVGGRVYAEAGNTAYFVLRLLNVPSITAIEREELESLVMQIEACPVKVSVLEIFTLDFRSLFTVAFHSASYLIILLQFHQT